MILLVAVIIFSISFFNAIAMGFYLVDVDDERSWTLNTHNNCRRLVKMWDEHLRSLVLNSFRHNKYQFNIICNSLLHFVSCAPFFFAHYMKCNQLKSILLWILCFRFNNYHTTSFSMCAILLNTYCHWTIITKLSIFQHWYFCSYPPLSPVYGYFLFYSQSQKNYCM